MKIKTRLFWKLILFITLFIIFIEGINYPVHALVNTKNIHVLVLNSYQKGFAWTDDETTGITGKLKGSGINPDISIEYLDWKRYPSQANLDNMYKLLKYKYSNQKIDLIVSTDDEALNFALKNRSDIFSDAPIVFCGVNNESVGKIIDGYDKVTGIIEGIDPVNTIKVALATNPSLKNVYVIYDNSESGKSTGLLTINSIKKINTNLNILSLNNKTENEILDTVKQLNKNSIVLMTSYFVDNIGIPINFDSFFHNLCISSSVPVFGLYDFQIGLGAFGGSMVRGITQGDKAGQIALRIIQGTDASSIPISYEKTSQNIYDFNQLKRFNISKYILPKDSIIINKQFSFVETYWPLVYSALGTFILLILFIIFLFININRMKKMKKTLEANNKQLTILNGELALADEKMRFQFHELKDYQTKLHFLAYHDALTGLYNRLYLYENIEIQLIKLKCMGGMSAVLFIDADNLKFVNDTMGHSFGDKLLVQISKRLASFIDHDSILFRFGGDEFIVYLKNIKNKDEVKNYAIKILEGFNDPFNIDNNILNITASIGISIFPNDATSIDKLLRSADMAMYKVKQNGRNGFYFFNSTINEEIQERVDIEKHFKNAMNNNEFEIYYQPQINGKTKKVEEFEALARWNSKTIGTVSPSKFIHIAEETGFIIVLGEWILKTACKFIKDLNYKKSTNYKIAVNISITQLLQDNFKDTVMKILYETGLSPSLLELEITESIIMESPDIIIEKLRFFRENDIGIALDDFGTGYSSLAYLRKIPLTTLKIDKSFIDDISSVNSNIAITDSIIDLGHKLGINIVAEGVETKEQLEYLVKNSCDKIQGYFYSKPMPTEEIEKFLHTF
jgi:diguanylate cyclase (GGDEF)-like protein